MKLTNSHQTTKQIIDLLEVEVLTREVLDKEVELAEECNLFLKPIIFIIMEILNPYPNIIFSTQYPTLYLQ
jgi:hypothetical protein